MLRSYSGKMIEYRFWSMRRSGHHAIINWVKNNIQGRVFFTNNVADRGSEFRKLKKNPLVVKDCDFYLYNIEERHIDSMLVDIPKYRHLYGYMNGPIVDVIVLRDPKNFFASRLASATNKPSTVKEFGAATKKAVNLYKHYMREFLRQSNYLHMPICVNFNKWFEDQNYRMHLSDKFNMPYGEKGMQTVGVPKCKGNKTGGISSFDNMKFNGKATTMDVLNRWVAFKSDSRFKKVLRDQEMMSLAESIFGEYK